MNITTHTFLNFMIDYSLIQALASVIANRGFERAAQKLFITQSAVSRRIQQLEQFVGAPVLIRTKPPSLTPVGQKLLTHLQQVMQLEAALDIGQGNTDSAEILSVRMATNADSLATWLPKALAVRDIKFSFDFLVEDQSVSLKRMKQGEVMVCICSEDKPVNGGKVSPLGALRYRAVASPDFLQYFEIKTNDDLIKTPCLVFDHNDRTQHEFIRLQTGQEPEYIHWCPSSEGFKQSMLAGIGFGMLPELQIGNAIDSGHLVDLFPGEVLDIPLFWHFWQTESPLLKSLRHHVIDHAKDALYQT